MELRAETTVAGARDAVFRVNRDKLVELVDYLPNVRKIVNEKRAPKGERLEMINTWHGGGEIPAALRKFLNESVLSWTDYAEWEESTFKCFWRSESHAFREAVDSRGHNEFQEAGPGRCRILIVGRIDVDVKKVPGIPRLLAGTVQPLIEGFLVKQVQANLIEVGRGAEKYLAAHGAP